MQRSNNDSEIIHSLFRNMKLEEHPEGHVVFNFGDRGQLFYIVITGQVSIMTPSPVELEIENTTAEGLLTFFVTYFEDVFWEKIINGDKIKRALTEEFKRLKLDLAVCTKEFVIKMMEKSI